MRGKKSPCERILSGSDREENTGAKKSEILLSGCDKPVFRI
jgi:hypothetical protein